MADCQETSQNKSQDISRYRKGGTPQRRQDADVDTGSFRIPHPIIVGTSHLEGILARRKVEIGDAPVVADIVPVGVKALEHIGIAVVCLRHVAQADVRNGERGLFIGNFDGIPVVERC